MIASNTRKPNRCRHCKERMPVEKAHHVIHDECIEPWRVEFAAKLEIKKARKKVLEAKVERALTRERRERLKTIPDRIKEAQTVFNAFIRERDRQAGQACISSGRPLDWSGNAVDAGHFRSVGAAPHLRFNEDNCHAQSKHDNQYKSGNVSEYRVGLIARIGLDRVEALESNNAVHKWTREELIAIKAAYTAKLKELKARTE